MVFLSTLLTSTMVTIALVPLFSALAVKFNALDMPDERKVHQIPIPRCGGIAMAFGAAFPTLLWNNNTPFVQAWLSAAGVLTIFGILDDFRGLGHKTKLVGQVIASLMVIVYGGVKLHSLGKLLPDGYLLPDHFAIPLTLLTMVGVTNAVNLTDGLDGLAGGISLMIFSTLGFLAYQNGETVNGLVAVAIVGVIFGFLRYNTFPASVFMGDTGSQLLGFSAAVLSIGLTQSGNALSPLLPLLLLGFPVLDTLAVICRRLHQGRSPFLADKSHFHHHLLKLGLYHPQSVMVIYLLQITLILTAFMLRYHSEWLLLSVYFLFSAGTLTALALATGRNSPIIRSGSRIDLIVAKLQKIREQGTLIRVTFRIVETGIAALLLIVCLIPRNLPGYFPWVSLTCAALLGGAWLFKRESLPCVLRTVVYLTVPFMVYLGKDAPAPWLEGIPGRLNNVLFGIFAGSILITSKFSRRSQGFKSTTMDLLIMLLVMTLIKIPGDQLWDEHIGNLTAKIIIFYFSYEVIIAEERSLLGRITAYTFAIFVIFSCKNFIY